MNEWRKLQYSAVKIVRLAQLLRILVSKKLDNQVKGRNEQQLNK